MAAAAASAAAVFLALSRIIGKKGGNAFDRFVVRQAGRVRRPWVTFAMRATTELGGVPGAALVSLTAIRFARARPRLALQIALGALGGITAELGLKRIFRRERPQLLAHLERVTSTSFPSGHSMAAASLYLTLGFVASRSEARRAQRAALVTSAAGVASLVAASRVYLGVHWPTDVLGGLALGTTWACATEALFDFQHARRLEDVAAKAALT